MSANEFIKTKIAEANELCKSALAASYRNACTKLEPGRPTPANNIFHTEEERAIYMREGAELRAGVLRSLDLKMSTIRSIATASPTQEAVNAVTMLAMNKRASEDDYRLAMERYGNNCTTANTITSLAADAGYTVPSQNDSVKKYKEMERLYDSISEVLSPNKILGDVTSGNSSFAAFYTALSDFSVFD